MRLNKSGGFNVPFCKRPDRFAKAYVTKIENQVRDVESAMRVGQYDLVCQDFDATIGDATRSDMIYADPPYINRHAEYHDGWDEIKERELHRSLSQAPCRFILSTWHSNLFRENAFIKSLWIDYSIYAYRHFYHIGAKEENRNPMIEALVANYDATGAQPTVSSLR